MTRAEHQSAEALFVAHARFVATFAHRLGVPSRDIEDVVQETFLVAHRRGGFSPETAKPTTWLAAITIRVWATLRRTRRRRPEGALASGEESLPSKDDVFSVTVARQSLERLNAALADLDEESRGLFVLFELEGASCEEIGRALGLPVGTVYSRLHHIRKGLRRHYAAAEPDVLPRLEGATP